MGFFSCLRWAIQGHHDPLVFLLFICKENFYISILQFFDFPFLISGPRKCSLHEIPFHIAANNITRRQGKYNLSLVHMMASIDKDFVNIMFGTKNWHSTTLLGLQSGLFVTNGLISESEYSEKNRYCNTAIIRMILFWLFVLITRL